MRVRTRIIATLLALGGVGAICDPKTPSSVAPDVEVYGGDKLLFATPAAPFDHVEHNVPTLWFTPLVNPPPATIKYVTDGHRIRFRSHTGDVPLTFPNGSKLVAQQEVHLFTRHPPEYLQTLLNADPNDPEAWRHSAGSLQSDPPGDPEMQGITCPADVVIPYPANAPAGSFVELNPLVTRDFWYMDHGVHGNVITHHFGLDQGGPGAQPTGTGSVKSLRLITHGHCSAATSMQGLLKRVKDEFIASFFEGVCADGLEGRLVYLEGASYLGAKPSAKGVSPREPEGGFLLRGRLHIEEHGFAPPANLNPCDITFLYDYHFTLIDGRLGVQPQQLLFDLNKANDLCTGFSFLGALKTQGAGTKVQAALEKRIPDTIFEEATKQQVVDNVGLGTFQCRFDNQTSSEIDKSLVCNDAANAFALALSPGVKELGLNGEQVAAMVAAVKDPLNWQCVARGSINACTPDARCEFIVRAKSVTVLPDAVELNFFDSLAYQHTGLIAYVLASASPGRTPKLCSRAPSMPRDASNPAERFYDRLFAGVHARSRGCSSRLGPYDPIPGSPPMSPGAPLLPPRCRCTSDGDCGSGSLADRCQRHDPSGLECHYACQSDDDCKRKAAGNLCVPLLGRCAYQPCTLGGAGFPPMPCPAWTMCKNYQPGGVPGTCVPKVWDKL